MSLLFRRLLVANRGEIAVRVIRACRELGIETVAVYSDADRTARHVLLADRAVRIGPASALESYLSIPSLVAAARGTGAEAVHPGYGFLSESAAFAQACADAGLTFIGPPPSALARMGSKVEARALAAARGVPVVPGETPVDQTDDALAAAARRVGFPVLVKPSAGGGGIGMHVVRTAEALGPVVQASRREARAAFGDGTLYVERLVDRPRHVEFQVFADDHGRTEHLFERECSLQRRHQKVIEETPSLAVDEELRARMGAAAVAAAEAVGYRNAGTVEFLLEGSGSATRFYFLEMNTRLQVEHPITEAVTGVDLVQAQIRVAAGAPLPWSRGSLAQRGHAIECRVYAEDPARDFLPQAGRLLRYREPQIPGVRVDGWATEGGDVPVFYDPLLAKVIACAPSRPAAIARMRAALADLVVLGIRTNVPFLRAILEDPAFIDGRIDTGYLDRATPDLLARAARTGLPVAAIAAAAWHEGDRTGPTSGGSTVVPSDPWDTLTGWRS